MSYHAPVKDMLFCMEELAGLEQLSRLPGFEDAGPDTARAVLEECARFNEGVIAPLNAEGDRHPSRFEQGQVIPHAAFDLGQARTEESQQSRVHHLALAGAGDEAGPRSGNLPVEKFHAGTRSLEQFASDAGRVRQDVDRFRCSTRALRR